MPAADQRSLRRALVRSATVNRSRGVHRCEEAGIVFVMEYSHLKDLIVYVHIKDGKHVKETDGIFPEVDYKHPGEGDADIERIVQAILNTGAELRNL